jgi:hypothetical protein
MRLVDMVLRQGHVSDQVIIEALMTGERPAHFDRCDICADRALEMGRWLDSVRAVADETADQAFPPERLAAQQSQILKRLAQVDEPARVIAFPHAPVARVESTGRRVAPAWVGVAAAAGLIVGVIGGQVTARLSPSANQTQPSVLVVAEPAVEPTPVSDRSPFDLPLEPGPPEPLGAMSSITPRLISTNVVGMAVQ